MVFNKKGENIVHKVQNFFDEETELKNLESEIHRISNLIDEQAEQNLVRITERQFREVFLPFFAADEHLPYKVDAGNWEKIAGSPFREVIVVNEYGQPLFKVPPLLNREAVNVYQQEGHDSMNEVLGRANNLFSIHPAKGKSFLNMHFSKRLSETRGNPKILETINIWNQIFKRYNRPLIIIKGLNDTEESVNNTEINKTESTANELDYEIEDGPI